MTAPVPVNRVRVSRMQVTPVQGTRVRVSRMSAASAAGPAPTGKRVRVSRMKATSGALPSAQARVRVSRIHITATGQGPGTFLWLNGAVVQARLALWFGGQVIPITEPTQIEFPENPGAAAGIYRDTYADTYGA